MMQKRNARTVEGSVARPQMPMAMRQQQQQPGNAGHPAVTLFLLRTAREFILGGVGIGIVVFGILSIIDWIQGHPWSHLTGFLAWIAPWVIVALILAGVALLCLVVRQWVWPAYKAVQEWNTQQSKETIKQRLMSSIADNVKDNNTKYMDAHEGLMMESVNPVSLTAARTATNNNYYGIQQEGQLLLPQNRVIVPPAYDLIDVVHTPEFKSGVFLGRIGASRSVVSTNPAEELCHGAIDAPTGGGKTVLLRGLEPQLLAEGVRVVHADIKFTLHDRMYDLDYRPIAKALLAQGNIPGTNLPHLLVTQEGVRAVIKWIAGDLIAQRLVLYREGKMDQLTLFYFKLEELAYLQSLQGRDKSLSQDLNRILIVGRSLNIKLFTAAQNFQSQNAGINTGNRENFESAWYLGGDDKSGSAILDIKETELKKIVQQNEIQLGKGVTFFRNNSLVHDATVMRAGMASNAYVYHMLGHADDFALPAEVTGNGKREATETRYTDNLSAFQEDTPFLGKFPTHGSRRLVERREALPDTLPTGREVTGSLGSASHQTSSFLPKGDDKLLPENLHEKLFSYYQDKGTVNEALEKMGITNSRFRRHAKFLVDQFLKREG